MRRVLIAACAVLLLVGQDSAACDKQSVHFSAEAMSSRITSRTLIMLQGTNVRIEENIELLVVVGKDGKPSCVSVVRGHPILVASAIGSVKDWRFLPYGNKQRLRKYSGLLVIEAKEFVFNRSEPK